MPEKDAPGPMVTWRCVTASGDTDVYRLAVPGGWLYRVRTYVSGGGHESVVFVPAPTVAAPTGGTP